MVAYILKDRRCERSPLVPWRILGHGMPVVVRLRCTISNTEVNFSASARSSIYWPSRHAPPLKLRACRRRTIQFGAAAMELVLTGRDRAGPAIRLG